METQRGYMNWPRSRRNPSSHRVLPYVFSYHKIQLRPWAWKCLAKTRCFLHASTPPSTCQLSYSSHGRGPSSLWWLQGCLPPTAPLSRQSIACPEPDVVPVKLWSMKDKAVPGKTPTAHHAEQPGPAWLRVKHRSGSPWLCVLVCDQGNSKKLERPKEGKRNIRLFFSTVIHLLTCLLVYFAFI